MILNTNFASEKSLVSDILSDTPVKRALRSAAEKRESVKKKVTHSQRNKISSKRNKPRMKAPKQVSSEEEDDDCIFIECAESYLKSKPQTTWLQSRKCSKWVHDHCTKFDEVYICTICNSDNDYDSSSEQISKLIEFVKPKHHIYIVYL